MLEAIKDYYYKTGKMVGMKPAGGISNSKLALTIFNVSKRNFRA
jgi:deoxyribose-phosphate aldolase